MFLMGGREKSGSAGPNYGGKTCEEKLYQKVQWGACPRRGEVAIGNLLRHMEQGDKSG